MGGSINKHCTLFPEIQGYKLVKETDSSTKYQRNDQTIIEFRVFETQSSQSKFADEISLIKRMEKQEFKGLAKIINYTIDENQVLGYFGGKRLCVLTELPKYTLKEYIKQYKKLTAQQIVELTTTIVGIQLLLGENNQFLGFNNIYTDDGMHWKLKLFQETNSFFPNFKKNIADPIGFPAPEESPQKDTPDKNRVQIFGFGMIILQLILGKPSSDIYPKCKFNEQILYERIDQVKALQKQYPGKFIEIFLYMLDPNLLNRWKYAQLVKTFLHHESFVDSKILSKFEYSDFIEKQYQKSKISNASKISTQITSRSAITERIKIEAKNSDIKLQEIQNNPKLQLLDGSIYQGNLLDNKQDGFGQLISSSGIILYKGQFKQGSFDGFGVQYNPNHSLPNTRINYHNLDQYNAYVERYEGYFISGKKCGNGILYYTNGELYQGEFKNDLPDGYGSFINQNHNQFQGRWSLGKFQEKLQIHSSVVLSRHQVLSEIHTILTQNQISIIQDQKEILEKNDTMEKQTIKLADSQIYYKGELVNQKMEGKGIIYFNNGTPQYLGAFKENLYHGLGTLHNEKPQILQDYDIEDIKDVFIKDWWYKFEGEFQFGMKHGEGILYLTDNSQFFGKFIDDKPVGEGFRKKVDDQYFNELWENGLLVSPILDK